MNSFPIYPILIVGAVILVLLFIFEQTRVRSTRKKQASAHLRIFERVAKEHGLTEMSRMPIGNDLRLFEPRQGIASADNVDRVIAGRWQERPVVAAAIRRHDPKQPSLTTWVNLVIVEAERASADAIVYHPDLFKAMTGKDALESDDHFIAVPDAPTSLRQLGVLAADIEVGREWLDDTLRRRVEELGDAVLVEVRDNYLGVAWASPPHSTAALEQRLDGAVALARRIPERQARPA